MRTLKIWMRYGVFSPGNFVHWVSDSRKNSVFKIQGLIMAEKKKETWTDVKKIIAEKDKKELIKLVGDLYRLNKANKTFLHTRFPVGEVSLEPYYKIVSDALYPDPPWKKPVSLSAGKKAISDYFKATNDKVGEIALMIYYVEMGTRFTSEYGDMDENFYYSLESVFGKAIDELNSQPEEVIDEFLPLLEEIRDMANNVGWGYCDSLEEMLNNFYDVNSR